MARGKDRVLRAPRLAYADLWKELEVALMAELKASQYMACYGLSLLLEGDV